MYFLSLARKIWQNLPWKTVGLNRHGRASQWSVALSASCLHQPQSSASFRVEFNTWLSGWRSASVVRSQVWHVQPGRYFRCLGSPWINVCRALCVSCVSPVLAKKWRRLVWMTKSSCGGEPAQSRTSAFNKMICVCNPKNTLEVVKVSDPVWFHHFGVSKLSMLDCVWLGSPTVTCRTCNPEVTQRRRFDSAQDTAG